MKRLQAMIPSTFQNCPRHNKAMHATCATHARDGWRWAGKKKHRHDHAKQPVSAVANSAHRLMTDPRVLQDSDAAIT
jgi:hypothetical protein